MEDMSKFRNAAVSAAIKGGDILKGAFKRKGAVRFDRKKDTSLVTEFDRQAEEIVKKSVLSEFPEHAILAEESGGVIGEEYSWLIDALDGTSNFIAKNPLFSVVISLLRNKIPVLSIVFSPILEEMYIAEKGKGAFLNDKPIKVSDTFLLKDSLFAFNTGRERGSFDKWFETSRKIVTRARAIRMFGSSALEKCFVAAGRADGILSIGISLWDSIGPAFIAKEAGGEVTGLDGSPLSLEQKDILITNGKIHKEVLSLLK